ncbi:MoaD/ThiS family protein [Proteiniborus sp. MB09-C3]|uniref:MoaD/ThiS family protein n=1 Tax=Proteiniborus sp. MB09-C3 TaxID=3050072 RepID=UPI0025578530|nr:MoaD/ThiS family protein [Proteiniborus sp. MB09-C3]WIV13883.1 MoaD/ThiS family protein [Proteiniborus sp. MB09-C3]
MNVEVRLFAYFREGREKKQIITLAEGTEISNVLDMLNIKEEEVSILLLNGRDGPSDRKLKNGDIVALFPPVGGG